LLSQAQKSPGAMINQGTFQPVGIEIGLGVKTAATTRMFGQGVAISTGRNLDVSIEGEGFMQVMNSDGSLAYTRDGSLKMDSMGQICTTDGLLIQPQTTIPSNASEINITADGNISVKVGSSTTQQIVGQIQLVKFQNPSGLLSVGHNMYVETPGSVLRFRILRDKTGWEQLTKGSLKGQTFKS